MHNLSPVYFVKHLYMFRANLQPIIRRYTVLDATTGTCCSFLDECLLSWLGWYCNPSQDNRIWVWWLCKL